MVIMLPLIPSLLSKPNLNANSPFHHDFTIIYDMYSHMQSKYIMQNSKLDEAQGEIKVTGININNLRYTDDTTLRGRK